MQHAAFAIVPPQAAKLTIDNDNDNGKDLLSAAAQWKWRGRPWPSSQFSRGIPITHTAIATAYDQ